MILIDLEKINLKNIPKYFTISIFILALILPGYGFIFITNQELLIKLAPTQLILTILLYSLPVFLFWMIEERISHKKDDDWDIVIAIQQASIKTLFYFYAFIIIYQVNFKKIKAEYLFYGIMFIFCLTDMIDSKIKNKQKSN